VLIGVLPEIAVVSATIVYPVIFAQSGGIWMQKILLKASRHSSRPKPSANPNSKVSSKAFLTNPDFSVTDTSETSLDLSAIS
jgi:hypothetical protein